MIWEVIFVVLMLFGYSAAGSTQAEQTRPQGTTLSGTTCYRGFAWLCSGPCTSEPSAGRSANPL